MLLLILLGQRELLKENLEDTDQRQGLNSSEHFTIHQAAYALYLILSMNCIFYIKNTNTALFCLVVPMTTVACYFVVVANLFIHLS